MTTAKAIESLREKMNISQRELAHQLGLTVTQVSRYENGRSEPKRQVQKKLAALAKVAQAEHLEDFFNAKWRADLVSRIEGLRSIGTERPVSVEDLESWKRWIETFAATVREQIDILETSARPARDLITLPANKFHELLGSIRRASGTAGYIADELKLYVGGPDATKISGRHKRVFLASHCG